MIGHLSSVLVAILIVAAMSYAQNPGLVKKGSFDMEGEIGSLSQQTMEIPEQSEPVTVDGILYEEEWSDAVELNLDLTLDGAPPTPSRVWLKNDNCKLYIAATLSYGHLSSEELYGDGFQSIEEAGCALNIWFDLDGDMYWDGWDSKNQTYAPDAVISVPGMLTPNKVEYALAGMRGWNKFPEAKAVYQTLRMHSPWHNSAWGDPPRVAENSNVVRKIDTERKEITIEGWIDYRDQPLLLQAGLIPRIRINAYLTLSALVDKNGDQEYTRNLIINGCWPTVGSDDSYYWYLVNPSDDRLQSALLTQIDVEDNYNVADFELLKNRSYDSYAYAKGSDLRIQFDFSDIDDRLEVIPFHVNVYGPLPQNSLRQHVESQVEVGNNGSIKFSEVRLDVPDEGFYQVEIVLDDPGLCGNQRISKQWTVLQVYENTFPCIVYPGDVNNDGLVNFADKKALQYIIDEAKRSGVPLHESDKMRFGPSFPDAGSNLEFVAQAALPWDLLGGCSADVDGNGSINEYDMIALEENWFRNHGAYIPKKDDGFNLEGFDVSNSSFPSPVHSTALLHVNLPEDSQVTLTLSDITGKQIQVLLDGFRVAGLYSPTLDMTQFPNGTYFITATMKGVESGIDFKKTMKVTVAH
ncbi:MAG: hypothetical protein CL946_01775 [Ectothiorhodospiraceae bacterium]|nr:hypothetical protein [Ectothiorhodospiraceae bacterium]